MRIVKLDATTKQDLLDNLLKRSPSNYGKYEQIVSDILERVKTEGDKAVFELTEQFDHATITEDTVLVTPEEIREAVPR